MEQLATAIRLGVYPRGTHAAARARAGRADGGLPGDPARGDRRPARGRTGRDHPRPAAAAPSSPSSRARPSARAAARISAERRGELAGRARLPPDRRARRRLPGREPRRSTTHAAPQLEHGATPRSAAARKPADAPAGRLALPPDDRVAAGLAAHDRGGHRGAGDAARDAAGDPGARAPTSPTPTASTARSSKAILAGRAGRGPPGHGAALRRHGRAAARPAGMTETEEHDLRNDRHLTMERPARPGSTRARSTPSSSPSPTCRAGCRASGCTAATSSTSSSAHGTEGCNYLLAVDVDMNTVDGYAISSWDAATATWSSSSTSDTIRLLTHLPATAMVQCDLVWPDHSPVRPVAAQRSCRSQLDRGRRARLDGARRHRARVHRRSTHLRGRRTTPATAT